MIKSLFPFLLYFSLSYALIQLGIALKLLSKTSDIQRDPKIENYRFRLVEADSKKSSDYLQINLYSCYNGTGL